MIQVELDGGYLPGVRVKEIWEQWGSSARCKEIKELWKYYDIKAPTLSEVYKQRELRRIEPNNYVPSAYYKTVVDSMAGYLFQDVQVEGEEAYLAALSDILDNADADVKDMRDGIFALATGTGIDYVYTTGDGQTVETRFASYKPQDVALVFDRSVEPKVIAGIRGYKLDEVNYYEIAYKDLYQLWKSGGKGGLELAEERPLFFTGCPFILLKTQVAGTMGPFQQVIQYVNALDFLLTGNQNELDKLAEAILVLSKVLRDEDKEDMRSIKMLEDMRADDRVEYLTRQIDPTFREYVSKLLIQEIHKHSHVIDWYSPDAGLSGEISAKAMKTRLFDMDMYSKRIELIYKEGIYNRIARINDIMRLQGQPVDDQFRVVFNRTLPDDFLETAVTMTGIDFLSKRTKMERIGIDPDEELKRIDEEGDTLDLMEGINNDL